MKRTAMFLTWLMLVLILVKAIYSIEMAEMSLASNPTANTTIVRHKRYLDFIKKSRMFVSCLNKHFINEI